MRPRPRSTGHGCPRPTTAPLAARADRTLGEARPTRAVPRSRTSSATATVRPFSHYAQGRADDRFLGHRARLLATYGVGKLVGGVDLRRILLCRETARLRRVQIPKRGPCRSTPSVYAAIFI